MLCVAFYAALEIYLDVTIRFALVTYLYGQEQVVDVDFSQMPGVLRWANRFATFSTSGLGLYFAFEARKLRYLRAPLMVYAVTLAWSAFLLLAKTTCTSEVLTTFSLFANFAPGTLAALGLFFAAAREDVWEVMRGVSGHTGCSHRRPGHPPGALRADRIAFVRTTLPPGYLLCSPGGRVERRISPTQTSA